MKIARDSVVTLDYVLRNDAGELLDESKDEPLTYIHGRGQMVPGLETALEGQSSGGKLKIAVPPKDAYGERIGGKELRLPIEAFPEDEVIEPGTSIEAVGEDGKTVVLWIVDRDDQAVSVSLDHPFAGLTLHFDIAIREVRAATHDELSHGHVHGPGGHHH